MDRRHIKSILKNIDKLERELYTRYTSKEIYDACIELEQKDGHKSFNPDCDLLSAIFSGVEADIDYDEWYNKTVISDWVEANK